MFTLKGIKEAKSAKSKYRLGPELEIWYASTRSRTKATQILNTYIDVFVVAMDVRITSTSRTRSCTVGKCLPSSSTTRSATAFSATLACNVSHIQIEYILLNKK